MKAKEFISNQNVALNFFWDSINIQVRIQGVINKLDEKKSDKYFYSRDIKKFISHNFKTIRIFRLLQNFHRKIL